MISQSSVAVATGCWNWDRRAARTTERSSISQGWGSPAFVFAFKSRGARRCEAPCSTPRVGPLRPQPPAAQLPFIKLLALRCWHGVGTASAFLWCFLVWRHWPSLEVPSAPGRSLLPSVERSWSQGTSWFHPCGGDQAGGGTHAAGVQGSLSSCNIPHLKYEAKFLLILHEEPGVNCVLPISRSRAPQSLCLHPPQAASDRDVSKSSSLP